MKRRPLAAAAAALLAAGCAGLHSSEQATQVYTLEPAWPATPARVTATVTLQVPRPLAAPGLDTNRIALTRGAQRLDYYAASSWPGPLPDFLQSLALDALRASGRFRAVQADTVAFAADQVLQIEVRRCQAEYAGDGPPVAHVQLVATLGQRSDRSLIAGVSAESTAPAAENRMQAVVAAFQRALSEALGQLVAQLPAPP
jgi:cholesterol transport system auxiliary component